MTHNDVLRRVRYALDLSDAQLLEVFSLGGEAVTLEEAQSWMRKEVHEEWGWVPQ